MTMWHVVGALSGQFYDAPAGTLRFAPRLSPPYNLPVLLPGSALTLSQQEEHGPYVLRFEGGQPLIQLTTLSVNGHAMDAPRPLRTLGDAMTWG